MDSINNKSVIQTLKNYLGNYKDVFYKRSFENFVLIVISMLYVQEIRSIKFLYERFIKKYRPTCVFSEIFDQTGLKSSNTNDFS